MCILTKNGIHGQWLIDSLRLRCICITRRLHRGCKKFKLRKILGEMRINLSRVRVGNYFTCVIGIPPINSKLLSGSYRHNRWQWQLRISVSRDMTDRRVRRKLDGHAHIIRNAREHHWWLKKNILDILRLHVKLLFYIYVEINLTKCIAELLGGCGSIKSCDGVCPKFLIWFSIASLIMGSVIVSNSTLPSYVK